MNRLKTTLSRIVRTGSAALIVGGIFLTAASSASQSGGIQHRDGCIPVGRGCDKTVVCATAGFKCSPIGTNPETGATECGCQTTVVPPAEN